MATGPGIERHLGAVTQIDDGDLGRRIAGLEQARGVDCGVTCVTDRARDAVDLDFEKTAGTHDRSTWPSGKRLRAGKIGYAAHAPFPHKMMSKMPAPVWHMMAPLP